MDEYSTSLRAVKLPRGRYMRAIFTAGAHSRARCFVAQRLVDSNHVKTNSPNLLCSRMRDRTKIRGPGAFLGLVTPFERAVRTVLRGASRGFAAVLVTRLRR